MRTTPEIFPGRDEDLLIAVANTGHRELDELADIAGVRAWWHDLTGDAASGEIGDQRDVELLRATRSVIRALALRNNGVEVAVDATVLGTLPLRFTVSDGPDLVSGSEQGGLVRDLTACTLAALLRASAGIGWTRLKACPGPDCGWVFHDRSRNGSRRWCDMAECGNRAKGAAFRARHRATS